MSSVEVPSPASGGRLLRETVYEQLRADMISCKLAPGAEIREAELAARFDMSKSPVRDALMRLEREGLVITLPRQGYRVAPVSLSDVLDMFHLRAALERACIERIVLRASDEQLKSLDPMQALEVMQGGRFAISVWKPDGSHVWQGAVSRVRDRTSEGQARFASLAAANPSFEPPKLKPKAPKPDSR